MSDVASQLAWDVPSKKMVPLDHAREQLKSWLVGTELVAFEYAAGFNLRFERSSSNSEGPAVLRLDVLSSARVGAASQWSAFCNSLPISARRTDAEEPALAYRLLLLVGASITATHLENGGTLSLTTSDGDVLTIGGTIDDETGLADTSWAVYVPAEVNSTGSRSIHCDSHGEISFR